MSDQLVNQPTNQPANIALSKLPSKSKNAFTNAPKGRRNVATGEAKRNPW